jgi:ABC-2 type transport system permease protein
MAGLIPWAEAREQFAAIALVRWQLLVNSLRTIRGRLEMVSRVLMGLWLALGGLGGAVVLGLLSYFFLGRGEGGWIALLLWIVFLFWQLFPVMAGAFSENFDSSSLLRFPLGYRSFFLMRLVYGSLDPGTALGVVWLLGILMGISAARPLLLLPAGLLLLCFAIVNLFLARAIFAWVERWLAKRRTREIMGVLFLVFVISFQFVGPLTTRFGRRRHPGIAQLAETLLPIERLLPPGLAASGITDVWNSDWVGTLGSLALLSAYAIALFWLLNLRMLALYRGENLSEAAAPAKHGHATSRALAGWDVPGVSGPIAAIFEKELRYLWRSGPMLFTLFMPMIILLIFRMTPERSGSGTFLNAAPDFAFPVAAAYALLMLTNLIYNNFGADGGGVQLWFISPVRFRDIARAKNLAHASIVGAEMVLVWLAVSLLFRPPTLAYTVATVAAVLFVTPVNLSVGNLLSISTPKKFDFGGLGRQRAASTTAFASLVLQAVLFGLIALAYVLGRFLGSLWMTTLILLLLAALACLGYWFMLRRIDAFALARRETLIAELSRA